MLTATKRGAAALSYFARDPETCGPAWCNAWDRGSVTEIQMRATLRRRVAQNFVLR